MLCSPQKASTENWFILPAILFLAWSRQTRECTRILHCLESHVGRVLSDKMLRSIRPSNDYYFTQSIVWAKPVFWCRYRSITLCCTRICAFRRILPINDHVRDPGGIERRLLRGAPLHDWGGARDASLSAFFWDHCIGLV